jgi:hypothetical protein
MTSFPRCLYCRTAAGSLVGGVSCRPPLSFAVVRRSWRVVWCAISHAGPAELIAETQVWRGATQVDPSDRRPTGPQFGYAARIFQPQLDKRIAGADTRTEWRGRQLLAAEAPSATADPFLPELEERLSDLTPAGFNATHSGGRRPPGPLPNDHPGHAGDHRRGRLADTPPSIRTWGQIGSPATFSSRPESRSPTSSRAIHRRRQCCCYTRGSNRRLVSTACSRRCHRRSASLRWISAAMAMLISRPMDMPW